MRTTLTFFFGGVLLVAVAGLALSQDKSATNSRPEFTAPHEVQAVPHPGSAISAADYPVIGYIEKRDRTITIKAGPKGPVYSVKTADGKVLFDNCSMEQLVAQAPELGKDLKTAVAGMPGGKTGARGRVKVDASLRDFGQR